MTAQNLTRASAELEFVLLSAEADSFSDTDFYAWLSQNGLPSELAIRLKVLVEATAEFGGRTINIGRLIIVKLIEFVKAHQNLAIGVAIGAAVAVLVFGIPFLGPFLAPVAAAIGISIGAIAGHRKDMESNGVYPTSQGPIAVSQDVIEIAKAFLKLFVELFQIVLTGALTPPK